MNPKSCSVFLLLTKSVMTALFFSGVMLLEGTLFFRFAPERNVRAALFLPSAARSLLAGIVLYLFFAVLVTVREKQNRT